ncbi:PREDICTED: ETS-related transcription factor Elf-3-like [Nicrophorus vespilloides]|uniref:ETS-related transcription factor Elf-3-like n=1 Tax=Nicrophorus vespilloides TaxID=110193 RepID=A0ABM1NC01_NICVS|nr:PREDICTED: ETS-related transcription factor Elf-3-like [Nicrophorus vespilloides]
MTKQWDITGLTEDDPFFRWIVEEVNAHVDFDRLLFPTTCKEPKDNQQHQTFGNVCSYYCLNNCCHNNQTNFNNNAYDDQALKTTIYQSKKSISEGKRMGKLWEFLRNLLLDERTCPSLIKWDNYAEGTFKFVQSEKVAQMWGNRKNNTKMNYEKLSRAMRYYYRTKVLLPVAGRRLVYKFGPRATGWRTKNPILD